MTFCLVACKWHRMLKPFVKHLCCLTGHTEGSRLPHAASEAALTCLHAALLCDAHCANVLKASPVLGKHVHDMVLALEGDPPLQFMALTCLGQLCSAQTRAQQHLSPASCCAQTQELGTFHLGLQLVSSALQVCFCMLVKWVRL